MNMYIWDICDHLQLARNESTSLQSMMNSKLSPRKQAHQEDSNDTPQPICEFQVDFPLLWIKDYPGLS